MACRAVWVRVRGVDHFAKLDFMYVVEPSMA